mgnify:CR=1 FL=1|tara:strand:+ start:310 stop:654 length:345 start_codon:yes stop_codon:yes gene_type:complete
MKRKMNKYELETQLKSDLEDRKEEIIQGVENGYSQAVVNEIVDNNVPIYNSDLLSLVSEDLNFGYQGEFKVDHRDDVNIFMILTNTVYEFLMDIAINWVEENVYLPREKANANK